MAEPHQVNLSGVSSTISFGLTNIPTKKNEDNYSVDLSHDILGISSFGIFDGHDGKVASASCSKSLNKNIVKRLNNFLQAESSSSHDAKLTLLDKLFRDATESCCEETDALLRESVDDGTTMVSLFIIERSDGSTRVYCPWIGDSRSMMCKYFERKSPKFMALTEDHNLYLRREIERIRLELPEDSVPNNLFARPSELTTIDENHFFKVYNLNSYEKYYYIQRYGFIHSLLLDTSNNKNTS